jgi:PAS domain S-box-containing protein
MWNLRFKECGACVSTWPSPPSVELGHKIISLCARPEEAEETLRAIHSGEVDALLISTGQGEQIFTLKGADYPFRLLIENMSEGALTITAEGLILYANQRFAQMLKKPPEKVPGSSILDWIMPADRGMLQVLLDKGNGRRRMATLKLVDGDGDIVPARFSLINQQLDGVSENICVVVTDLTEHERMEGLVNDEKIARQT